jgi:hypothetical protein
MTGIRSPTDGATPVLSSPVVASAMGSGVKSTNQPFASASRTPPSRRMSHLLRRDRQEALPTRVRPSFSPGDAVTSAPRDAQAAWGL